MRRWLAFGFVLLAGCGRASSRDNELSPRPHSVTLHWKASTSTVVGYNVYRSYPPGAPFKKLTPQVVTATQYVDTTAEGGDTYVYYVTSVDSKGGESLPSAPTTVTVPRP